MSSNIPEENTVSIIDGMMNSEGQMIGALQVSEKLLEQFFGTAEFTPKQKEIIDLVREGIPLGSIMGITQQHRDAMFTFAVQAIQAGDRQKARDILLQNYLFDPLEENRSVYAIANTYQLDGVFDAAAKLYLNFLAMDATNPDGYLRLGECFMAAQEYDNAQQSFESAARFAERGLGSKGAAEHAAKMLAVLAERRAEASN
ncbi:hypothetical protein ABB55_07620 [Prosthecomicrobium hirschii]|uniref:Uncharacterized protein n=1 Tax=Prosthecodimorpha hirschii TaxID=665126 RepID=A0A0P6W1P9_9HYPH|nr:hypothetical protein ABB55_07620 [Prosthecomicrobium hirschii]TPQ49012.1 hypothetical protein C2U72_20720 [Prosthecomicrobium hirschii]